MFVDSKYKGIFKGNFLPYRNFSSLLGREVNGFSSGLNFAWISFQIWVIFGLRFDKETLINGILFYIIKNEILAYQKLNTSITTKVAPKKGTTVTY